MASYVDNGNKLDWALSFQRTGDFPIDRSSMFNSYADAVKYAKGDSTDPDSRGLQGSSYVGQIIAVYENNTVNIYKIDADRTLSSVGSGGGGGTSDYSDLTNKPSINNVTLVGDKTSANLGLQPAGDYALRSEIPDVSNFITVTVDNLVNYYLKSETYNKQEVNSLISAISTATFELVNELPQTGESNVIYLVPSSNPGTQNVKDEYIWINNSWEQIGSTSVDLTGYATETWVNTQIANFLTQAQIELLINTAISGVNSSIANINSKIPNQASDNNQLADKNYVESAISTATATFRGTFDSLNTLQATEGDKNDYAFYSHSDSSGNTVYDRYKYVGIPESELPEGYIEVDSINCVGDNGYINTEITPSSTLVVETALNSPNFNEYAYMYFMGSNNYSVWNDQFGRAMRIRRGGSTQAEQLQTKAFEINSKNTLKIAPNGIYVNGTNIGSVAFEDTATNPIYLFTQINNNGTFATSLFSTTKKIYRTKFINNNEVIADMVPCYREIDYKAGFYDVVRNKFYINDKNENNFTYTPLSTDKWEYEYSLSNLNLTPAQWSTLNSGLVANVTSNGYDATKTQVLKNINGTLTWQDET